jgi:hypothetical protein
MTKLMRFGVGFFIVALAYQRGESILLPKTPLLTKMTTAQKMSVDAVISSRYAGFSVKEVAQKSESSRIYYQVTVTQGSAQKNLLFNSTWQFIDEKI